VKEITSLGLTYNLLTAYTSFVAIDDRVRTEGGETVTIKQPLPLPQGVSDYAVGGRCQSHFDFTSSAPMNLTSACEEKLRLPVKGEAELLDEEGDMVKKDGAAGLSLQDVRVQGPAAREDIEAVLEQYLNDMALCCETAGRAQLSVGTRLVIAFRISDQGRVSKIHRVRIEALGDPKVFNSIRQCVRKGLWTLRFDAVPGGGSSEITAVITVR
jgi:Ca-activated chloride channel family protein